MSVSQRVNVAYSLSQPLSNIFPSPIVALRVPLTTDKAQLGTVWVDKTTNQAWILTSIVSNSATWVSVAGGSGSFATLTVGSNFSVQPTVINIGTNAVAQTITIGNTDASTAVDINTGTGGFSVSATGVGPIILTATQAIELVGPVSLIADGVVSMQPVTATAASPTASITSNNRVITATFTGFTTASGSSQAYTIVSSDILTTSGIFVTVSNLNASTNGAEIGIVGITQAAGSIVINTKNNGAGALGSGDNVLINVWIIS